MMDAALLDALRDCQRALAVLIDPKSVAGGVSTMTVFAQCTAAEVKARRVLAEAAETWRHVRTGGLYRIVGRGRIEAEATAAVAYQSVDTGDVWYRPETEFFDGRFVLVDPVEDPPPAPPLQGGGGAAAAPSPPPERGRTVGGRGPAPGVARP